MKFPKGLKYDGSHVLRHGGAAAALKLLKLPLAEAAKKMKMSPAMVRHYSADVESRLITTQRKSDQVKKHKKSKKA